MSKRTSAAIIGLLDDIKAANFTTIETSVALAEEKSPQTTSRVESTPIFIPDKSSEVLLKSTSGIDYEIKQINPAACTPWEYANRISSYISTESCAELIDSIQKVGQKIPALVRKNKTGRNYEYELVYGARRLFACKHLGINLLAAVVELSDKEAFLAMDAENRPRQDISPYERALDYSRWIKSGVYKNYVELGESIGVKKAWFSKLMALAELDESIIKAFKHPSKLLQKWGYELYLLCQKDAKNKQRMINLANQLTLKELSPEETYSHLKALSLPDKKNTSNQITLVRDKAKKPIFKIIKSSSGDTKFIFSKTLSPRLIDELQTATKALINNHVEIN